MLYKPLKYFLIYIIFTVLISFYGPTEYYNYDKVSVVVFMLVFLVVFSIAYIVGAGYATKIKPSEYSDIVERKMIRILKFSIFITFVISIWGFIDYVSKYGISIKNLGQAYIDLYTGYERNSGRSYSPLELLTMFTGILKQISIVLGIFYYKKINNKWKFLLWFSWTISIFTSLILTGKQKILGDIIVYITSVFLITNKFKFRKISKKYVRYIWLATFIVGFLFVYIQKQRYSIAGINLFNYNIKSTYHVFMNPNHIVFRIFGTDWGFPIAILLTTYLSGGYYGLSLCLKTPFVWTYGFGHSYALSVIANRFLGFPFYFENVYVIRMEQEFGWPAMSKWHTIFPYLASDLTFIGSIIFFAVIAFIYAISYIEALKYKNPVSLLLFTTLNIMLIFVPANNQLMIGPEAYFGYITILFVWIFFHRRYNVIHKES